jgi:2,5-diketo-D-gluconate reductase A
VSQTQQVPTIELNDRARIPQLGFGVFQIPPEDTEAAVADALEAGYRHVDTAAVYGNEAGVGRAIAQSGIPREELFVTTKVWNSDHGRDATLRAFAASAERLGLEYADLYLVHWPVPTADRYVETFAALVELRDDGRVRSVGVSNFNESHLRRVIAETGVTPSVNQVELHPYLQQAGLRRVHRELGIVTEAWSPIAQGAVLEDPEIVRIAADHGKSPAQVVLRWQMQIDNVAIPKSVTPARMRENRALFDFELAAEDLDAIARLDRGLRTGPDPDVFADGLEATKDATT